MSDLGIMGGKDYSGVERSGVGEREGKQKRCRVVPNFSVCDARTTDRGKTERTTGPEEVSFEPPSGVSRFGPLFSLLAPLVSYIADEMFCFQIRIRYIVHRNEGCHFSGWWSEDRELPALAFPVGLTSSSLPM